MKSFYAELLLFIPFLVFMHAYGDFNCLRDNNLCSGNGKCEDAGNCTCAITHQQYDCLVDKSQLADCTLKCNNGGLCYKDSTDTMKCHCPFDYYGTLCENLRVPTKPTCEGTSMKIVLSPYVTGGQAAAAFAGVFFIEKFLGKTPANCPIVIDAAKKIATVTMSYGTDATKDCGTTMLTDKPQAGQVTYENTVVIQSNKNYLTSMDQRITTTCIMSGSTVVNGTVTKLDTDNTNLPQQNINDTKAAPLALQLTDGKIPLDPAKTKKVGEQCDLELVLSDTTIYKKIKAQTCVVESGDKKSKVELVKDGCRQSAASSILSELKTGTPPAVGITLPMKVFKFVGKNELVFTCTVLLCRDGQTQCDQTTCNSKTGQVGLGIGRKKRSANAVDEKTVQKRITVSPSESDEDVPEQGEVCPLLNDDILVILIVLGSAVFMLCVLSVVLSMCIVKLKSKKYDDTRSIMSSATSLKM